MEPNKKMFEGYKMYIVSFIVLSILTLLSVGLTEISVWHPLVVGLILIIAAIQVVIVLLYNMHLKFHDKILTIFVGIVFSVIFFVIIVTMLDFVYR
jgi:heme/copper-type cytochrome/quinol oxidase subunit 4